MPHGREVDGRLPWLGLVLGSAWIVACHDSVVAQSRSGAINEIRVSSEARDAGSELRPNGATEVQCRSRADCPPSANDPSGFKDWTCIGPQEAVRCGPVLVPAVVCDGDQACNSGQVCRSDPTIPPGWLGASGMVCAAPCVSDGDCASTRKCKTDGHCVARTCAECPNFLSCEDGACRVPNCSTDSDCPSGHCVNGSCSVSLGLCRVRCF